MTKYIIKRLIAMVITLFLIVSIAFFIVRFMPGSMFEEMSDAPPEVIAMLEAKYNIDKPIPVQYWYFIKDIVFDFDWGSSIKIQPLIPVFEVIRSKIPITVKLNICSLLIAVPIGCFFGITAALKKNTMIDHSISLLVVLFISVPSFVFASLLQYFFAFKLGKFPIIYDGNADFYIRNMSMVLPVLALMFSPIARITRYMRAELIDTVESDFMLLARTKGLTHAQATIHHALRNSFVPLANIMVPMIVNIMGGSLVIERIFAIPGMGGIMISSINAADHPLTIATILFYSIMSLGTILLVDISYGIIDPRIRLR